MPDLDHIRREIERMRVQVQRQRKEILQLQRAGDLHGLGRTPLGADARQNRRPLCGAGQAQERTAGGTPGSRRPELVIVLSIVKSLPI